MTLLWLLWGIWMPTVDRTGTGDTTAVCKATFADRTTPALRRSLVCCSHVSFQLFLQQSRLLANSNENYFVSHSWDIFPMIFSNTKKRGRRRCPMPMWMLHTFRLCGKSGSTDFCGSVNQHQFERPRKGSHCCIQLRYCSKTWGMRWTAETCVFNKILAENVAGVLSELPVWLNFLWGEPI